MEQVKHSLSSWQHSWACSHLVPPPLSTEEMQNKALLVFFCSSNNIYSCHHTLQFQVVKIPKIEVKIREGINWTRPSDFSHVPADVSKLLYCWLLGIAGASEVALVACTCMPWIVAEVPCLENQVLSTWQDCEVLKGVYWGRICLLVKQWAEASCEGKPNLFESYTLLRENCC